MMLATCDFTGHDHGVYDLWISPQGIPWWASGNLWLVVYIPSHQLWNSWVLSLVIMIKDLQDLTRKMWAVTFPQENGFIRFSRDPDALSSSSNAH